MYWLLKAAANIIQDTVCLCVTDLLTRIVYVQIVLAILAILKFRKGVENNTLSATPSNHEAHHNVPPIAAAEYNEHDSQFAPHPFGTKAASSQPTAAAEHPAY